MEIQYTPHTAFIRVFADGKSYHNKDDYDGIMTVQHLGEERVFLSGAKGVADRKMYVAVLKFLKEQGIKEYVAERHGKLIVKEL